MTHWFIAFVAVLAAMPASAAECSAASGAPRTRLVELYTSEGCSSCPPADEWLRRLSPAATALAFHVDYWDSLGWRDRFADPRYTRRQEEQARRDHGGGIYTPQVVLDGRSWSGWYRGSDSSPAVASEASMHLRLSGGGAGALHVRLDTTFDHGTGAAGFANYIALTEDGLATQVRAGENRGALLRHDHVVRAFAGPLPLESAADLRLPDDAVAARATLVAFVQRAGDGAVAQVVSCPLAAENR